MALLINEYNFFLDSKYRTGGNNTTPEWALSEPIILSNPNNYFSVCVKSCEIPYSFKNLNSSYNTLRVQYVETGHVNQTTNIILDEGNYNILELLDDLKTKIISFLTPIAVHIPAFNFTYDRITGKCTLLMTKQAGNHQTFLYLYWSDVNINADLLGEFFGFTQDTILYYNGAGVPNHTNNISNIHVNTSPITSLYIRSFTLTQPTNNEEYLVEFKESVSDILLKMPVNSSFNSWLMFQNTDEIKINNKSVDVIGLYLTALTYDPLNLGGVHWRTHLKILEYMPEYVRELEIKQQEDEKKINEIENIKQSLIDELENIKGDLSGKIKTDNMIQSQTVEDLKKEFINNIEENKKNNIL